MTKHYTIYIGSLLLLLTTVLASARVGRQVNIWDFPMDRIPTQLGDWRRDIKATPPETPPAPGDMVEKADIWMAYDGPNGGRVTADLKVTSSRVGSLRDYAVALVGDGWTPQDQIVWETDLPGVPYRAQLLQENFTRGSGRLYTLNWFFTSKAQALTLDEASVAAWRAQLGPTPLWGQAYLTARSKGDDEAAVLAMKAFARELLPVFYSLLSSYHANMLHQSQPVGERGSSQ